METKVTEMDKVPVDLVTIKIWQEKFRNFFVDSITVVEFMICLYQIRKRKLV